MANFTYKKTENVNMKLAGILDTDRMIIEIDGEDKKLVTLLSDFNGAAVEIKVNLKNETELDEPTSAEE